MTKKLIIAGILVVGCLWVAKKTSVLSYASTVWCNGRDALRKQIPRDLELARVKNEITNLDRDYQALFPAIAERMANVKRLESEVQTGQNNLKGRRDGLLTLTSQIDAKQTQISYNGGRYNLDQARVKLAREFTTFKQLEVDLQSKEKLLSAEQQSLAANREQLDKLITQKREFEVRLAQLEAEEAMLRAQATIAPLKTDDGRVADIDSTLKRLAHEQQIEVTTRELRRQYGPSLSDATPAVETPSVDVNDVRNYLEGRTATTPAPKVAQDK